MYGMAWNFFNPFFSALGSINTGNYLHGIFSADTDNSDSRCAHCRGNRRNCCFHLISSNNSKFLIKKMLLRKKHIRTLRIIHAFT